MNIGQLWYGSSAGRADGVAGQRLIAGSGKLANAKELVTQFVLQSCYQPRGESFAWRQTNGVRVVVQRRLTGLDDRGRPGAYFVHAIATNPETLPPAVLGRLLAASVWRERADEPAPDRLPVLRSIDELGLEPAVAVEEEVLVRVLASHLANAAGNRPTALLTDARLAAALAARIAELLPARFGLLSFSTDEPENAAEDYDIVAGPPPTPRFKPVDPDHRADPVWTEAARLLMAAEVTSEAAARGAVESLAEQTDTPAAFATALQQWVQLEHPAVGRSFNGEYDAVVADPRLVVRLLEQGDGAERVLAGLPWSRSSVTFVRTALGAGVDSKLQPATVRALTALNPVDAIDGLERVQSLSEPLARQATRQLVERWNPDHLEQLDAMAAHRALRLIAHPNAALGRAGDSLLALRPHRDAASDARLPVSWRVQIVMQDPLALGAVQMIGLLLDAPTARALAALANAPELQRSIAAALEVTDLGSATRALANLESDASSDVADVWRRIVYRRLPLHQRLDALARTLWSHAPAWAANDYVAALVAVVLEDRTRADAFLPGHRVAAGLAAARDPSVTNWAEFLTRIEHFAPEQTKAAAFALTEMPDRHWDAGLELLVDAAADFLARGHDWGTWRRALTTAMRIGGEQEESMLWRVVRAAVRRPNDRYVTYACIKRLSYDIDAGTVHASVLSDTRLDALRELAPSTTYLRDYQGLREITETKQARKWLGAIVKDSEERAKALRKRR